MTRTKPLILLLFLVSVIVVSLVDAQEKPAEPDNPPVRLKKKKRTGEPAVKPPMKEDKDPDPPKEKPKEEDPVVEEDGPDAEPQEDDKEILERIERNMRGVEEKLGNRELGDPTSQQQRDIVKDIDSLIKRKQQSQGGGGAQQPQQGGGGGGEQDKQQQKGGGKSQARQKSGGGTGPRSMAQNGKQRRQQRMRQRQGRQTGTGMAKMQPGSENKPEKNPGGTDNTGTGVGKGKESDKNKVADPDTKAVWGHLPESLRAQMNAYSNPSPFMPRYDDLIKKYYRTIAEQGRKKGD